MGKILPVLLAVIGLGAGVGAGMVLKPAPGEDQGAMQAAEACPPPGAPGPGDHAAEPQAVDSGHGASGGHGAEADTEFVKFSNQFVIPVMGETSVESMVVLSLSIETATGSKEAIYQREPKLRDAFLGVLFNHASAGGFDGNFVNSAALDTLRDLLRETARDTVGPVVKDVLIVDLVKQGV